MKSEKYRLVFMAMDLQRKDYMYFSLFTFHFSLFTKAFTETSKKRHTHEGYDALYN